MKIKEIQCRSVLTKTRIPASDYVINPYIGCQHACVYCYARFIKRFRGHNEPWGQFVDVKVNASEVLAKELPRAKKGVVFLSSICDPYQPLEKKYRLTRKILESLLKHQFPIAIQTKSSLVLKDIDLFKKFDECYVGFTITVLDDNVRKKFEPFSSSIQERIDALKTLHENGISTYAFIGPILPFLIDIPKMFLKLNDIVDEFMFENLNTRGANWVGVERVLKENYPDILPKYKEVFFTKKRKAFDDDLKKEITSSGKKYKKKVELFFEH